MLDKGQGAIRAGHLKNLRLWQLSFVQGPVFDWWHLIKKDAGMKKQRTNKTANCKSFRRTNPSQQVSVNTASWRSSWKETWPTIWSIQWSLLLSPSPFTRYLSENVQIDSHETRNWPNSPHQVTSLHCEVDRLCSTFLPVHQGQMTNDQWFLGRQISSLLGPKEKIKTCMFLEMAYQHKSKGFVSPLQTPTGVRSKALEGHICTFHMDICLGVIHQHEIHCMTPYLEVSKPQSVETNHL